MRIFFLCGSLELGRDGVGDYTRLLAEECEQQGNQCFLISLHDRYVAHITSLTFGNLPVLRLPSSLSWSDRIERILLEIDRFAPDWISLQFVSYAFHPKGLIYGLAEKLRPLVKGKNVHIMFHELWLCKELGWRGKERIVGALQGFFIRRFVKSIKPAVIHTSNDTYAAILNRHKIATRVLGLFGAVRIEPEFDTIWIESQLRTVLGEYHREALWLFGFFGALHPQWPPEPLLTYLYQAAQVVGRKPVLLSIGRTGSAGSELWNRVAREYGDRFSFVQFGEQPTAHISEYLSYLDVGIATTPRSIIGKSSTAVSMLEHGLPVIVNRDDIRSVATPLSKIEPLLIACNADLKTRLQAGLTKGARGSRTPKIAMEFVSALHRDIN